jgi:hypothetical protein
MATIADTPYTVVIKHVLSRSGAPVSMVCTDAIMANLNSFKSRADDEATVKQLLSMARDVDEYIIYALDKHPGLFTIESKPVAQSMETTVDDVLSQVPENVVCRCTATWLRIMAKIFDGKGTTSEISSAKHMTGGRASTRSRVTRNFLEPDWKRNTVVRRVAKKVLHTVATIDPPVQVKPVRKIRLHPITDRKKMTRFSQGCPWFPMGLKRNRQVLRSVCPKRFRTMLLVKLAPFGVIDELTNKVLPSISQILADA